MNTTPPLADYLDEEGEFRLILNGQVLAGTHATQRLAESIALGASGSRGSDFVVVKVVATAVSTITQTIKRK